jgi:NADPH:quinone reductase-like Zn-dependent oxidoreductase
MPASAVVLFDELHVKAGDWIVQNAANGTVGTILVRIAQNNGVNVLNLVRRESAAVDMRNAGAKHVIVTDGSGWQQQARELIEEAPIVRAIDSISGSASLDLQRLLAQGGEMIVFGGLAGQPMKLDPSLMISNELVVRGFWMTAWMQRATAEQRANASRTVFEMAMKNELPLPVAAVFPLDKAAAALKAAEAPGRGGKVLLRP